MGEKVIRALIVEDDSSWQQILSEILLDLGMEVDLANNYEEAVEKARGNSHRLAILDLSLGGTDHHNQDGLRVAETVRRLDPGSSVLFLTGFATVELAVRVMKDLGAFTCLRKEAFRRSEFRKIVNEALAYIPPGASLAVLDAVSPPAYQDAAAGSVETPVEDDPGVVLIVEDDAGWRSLLTELLQDGSYRMRTSSSYLEALGLLKRERVWLAVVDLSLASSLSQENQDGFRLLTATQKANIPVIVVSGLLDPKRMEQAYRDRLVFACMEKQAFDRKEFLRNVSDARRRPVDDPILRSLTEREREVLVLLARGLTNKEIAYKLTITPNTVKRHLKSLFAKLDVNTRSAASAKAISMGIDNEA